MNQSVKFNLPFSLGLPDQAPTIENFAQVKNLLDDVYNAFAQFQMALHNYVGVGQQIQSLWSVLRYDQTLHQFSPNRLYVPASEPINFGAAVNIFDSAGVLSARNANATDNTKPAHGVCTTAGGVGAGAYGEFILLFGLLTGVSGLTRGSRYFLSTSNGLLTAVAPVAAGNIEQALGLAVDTTALLFNIPFSFIQH